MSTELQPPVIGVIDSGLSGARGLAHAAARQRSFGVRSMDRDEPVAADVAGLIVDVPLEHRAELVAHLRKTWRVPILIESPITSTPPVAGLANDDSIVSANPLRYGLHTRHLLEEVSQDESPLEAFFVAWRFRVGVATVHALPQLLDYLAGLHPGDVCRISAMDRRGPSVLTATLRYASGTIGSLEVGSHLPPSFPSTDELVIECACSGRMYHCTPGHQSVAVYGHGHTLHDWQADPADAMVASFATWLIGGPRPFGSIRADLNALGLNDQILRAAQTDSVLTTTKGF